MQFKKPARGKLSGKGPFSRTENKWPTISRKNLLVKVSANFIHQCQSSERNTEKISVVQNYNLQWQIKRAQQFLKKILNFRGAPDIVSGRINRPDSGKIVLSGIRPDIYYYPAGYRIIRFS